MNSDPRTPKDIQADQYGFPYHYIPGEWPTGFLSRHWSFSPSYVAALHLVRDALIAFSRASDETIDHLDIGCGDGALISFLSRIAELQSGAFKGVDLDGRSISWARMMNPAGDFDDVDVAGLDRQFGSASLIEVLEHIPISDVAGFFASSMASLRPGGLMIVTVPSTNKPVEAKHYQHFTKEMLLDLATPHLADIEVVGFERHTRLTRAIQRLRNNRFAKIDAPALNAAAIKALAQKKGPESVGVGRLFLTGRRKG